LIGSLAGNLDANHWITGIHDRADDAFDASARAGTQSLTERPRWSSTEMPHMS